MRIIACLAVVLLCSEVYAGCPNGQCNVGCVNGRCQLNRPVVGVAQEAVQVTRDVAVGTVQVARNVTVGTVRAVTPPYRGRCVNGRCRVR